MMSRQIYYNNQSLSRDELHKIYNDASPTANVDRHDLHLAVSQNSMGESTFALFSGLDLPPGFLETNKIFTASYIRSLILSHAYFSPLSNAIAEAQQNKFELKPATFIVLAWYYLTDSAISVPFMKQWLLADGYSEESAEALTLSVYMSRTERDDSAESSWINKEDGFEPIHKNDENRLLRISSKENYFQSALPVENYVLVYDDFAAYEQLSSGKQGKVISCKDIPETAMLVEDHHHIILGLSTLLCEVMTLCDFAAPTFNAFILDRIHRSETTYMSLGTFLHEYTDQLAKRIHLHNFKLSLKLMDNAFIAGSVSLEKGISFFSSQNSTTPLLPLFLDIEKA